MCPVEQFSTFFARFTPYVQLIDQVDSNNVLMMDSKLTKSRRLNKNRCFISLSMICNKRRNLENFCIRNNSRIILENSGTVRSKNTAGFCWRIKRMNLKFYLNSNEHFSRLYRLYRRVYTSIKT